MGALERPCQNPPQSTAGTELGATQAAQPRFCERDLRPHPEAGGPLTGRYVSRPLGKWPDTVVRAA